MVEVITQDIQENHPDYVAVRNLLQIAQITWQKFGISASELSELDEQTFTMIVLASGK